METSTKSNSSSAQNNGLCRVCLSANEDNKCIFSSHKNLDHENYNFSNLWEKLQLYGGIEVAQNDGFPAKMCNECICKMRIAHGFRARCQETDRILRAAYKNNLNVQCWTKEKDTGADREFGATDEHLKLEEIHDDESLTSPAAEITDPRRFPEGSEKETPSDIDKVGDDELASKKQLSQIGNLIVVEKNNFVKARKPWRLRNDQTIEDCSVDIRGSRLVSRGPTEDVSTDTTEAKEDAPLSKKEMSRSRRFVVFKRVTSMQSLKNCKERQRRYIKKTVYGKNDGNDGETSQTDKSNHSVARRVSDAGSALRHECFKCGRSYSSKISLEIHELSHNREKFSCDKCDKRFGMLNDFLEHAKLHDLKEKLKPTSCKICNKNFRKSVTMIRHLNVHKRDNPRAVYSILKDIRDKRKLESFESPIEDGRNFAIPEEKIDPKIGRCKAKLQNYRDSTTDTFSIDSNSDDDSEPFDGNCAFNCEQCGKRCCSEKSLQRHFSNHEEHTFSRTVRDKKIVSEERLNSRRESCGRAKETTRQNSRFALQLEPQNPPDDRSAIKLINTWIKEELDSDNEGKGFSCENCNKSYVTKKSLSKHRAKMHENLSERKAYCCPTCGEDCVCVDRIKEGHGSAQEKSKSYTCEECNKTFEKEVKLEKHIRIHARAKEQQDTNFKRFLCHICSKTFRQNTGLMFHMRTHTGYKPHVCKYCGRGFTSNSNCINHERTHTGDRPFVCHFCSAAFAKSCTLKAHITTHTGEANYHCKTCGKSFRRLKYLKEHRFTHTGEKPYACKICGTAYSHSGSLFVHEKKCKAQHVNYQALSVPVSQNYYENQPITIGESSAAIAPIIVTLPSSHDITSMSNTLNTHENKNYVDGLTRINANCTSGSASAPVHSSTANPDIPSAVRCFTIIGQMFHT